MGRIQPRNKLLACDITRNGVLRIEIGVESLAFAACHGPMADRLDPEMDDKRFTVSDARAFAADVRHELLYEAEDGSTLVHRMLAVAHEPDLSSAIDQATEADARASRALSLLAAVRQLVDSRSYMTAEQQAALREPDAFLVEQGVVVRAEVEVPERLAYRAKGEV